MKNPYQQYKKTSIESASREKLLLLMYEGAIRYTKKARIAIENNDIAERGLNIGKAYDIILELNNTLDHEVGGEIAINLEQLYMFLTDRLTEANINAKVEPLDDVIKILHTLYDGWKKAIEQLKKQENTADKL
ncbi:MAG: flagellar export chaperone FliS [Bdellovibrionaceae bacterium]|nr:flagellar export chaperone FliS [Pseudobdellovibrionaceae bacterium]|tara:strand:+ start:86935 stop:87333 length:399 start_codon:yes stop_codon:yes gene_type:complete